MYLATYCTFIISLNPQNNPMKWNIYLYFADGEIEAQDLDDIMELAELGFESSESQSRVHPLYS